MLDFTGYIKDHKCMSCGHSPVCANNLGGADLDIVGKDCSFYLPACVEIPQKFYIVLDVPGFYDITEYRTEKVLYSNDGRIEKIWGKSAHSSDIAHAADFGRTVFFNRAAAEDGLKRLIEEYKANG